MLHYVKRVWRDGKGDELPEKLPMLFNVTEPRITTHANFDF